MKQIVAESLKAELESKGISIYRLSKLTGIKYELLRRVFQNERKLTADELLLVLRKTGIAFENMTGETTERE